MVSLKCNSQVILQLNNILDNNSDSSLNTGNKSIKPLYKAINQKRIAWLTTRWNGAIRILIQEQLELLVINAKETLLLPIGSITVTHVNQICAKTVESLE